MTGKPDKERMGQDMKYVIDSETYEKHIRDEVHLYGLLHQLAFLAGKVKDAEDMANLVETARRYGEIAEEKFDDWLIPGRYLVFGDRADLTELKAAELTPLTAVLKEHDAKIKEKQRAATAHDPAYIISGSAFRMLVGDLGGEYKFILATQNFFCKLHADLMGLLRRDLPRLKGLDQVAAQVRSLVDGMAAGPGKFDIRSFGGAAIGRNKQLSVRLFRVADIVNGRFQR